MVIFSINSRGYHWWIQRLLGISPNSLGVDPWITLLGISHKKYRGIMGILLAISPFQLHLQVCLQWWSKFSDAIYFLKGVDWNHQPHSYFKLVVEQGNVRPSWRGRDVTAKTVKDSSGTNGNGKSPSYLDWFPIYIYIYFFFSSRLPVAVAAASCKVPAQLPASTPQNQHLYDGHTG